MGRPHKIKPATSIYQFMKIKDRVKKWLNKDIEDRRDVHLIILMIEYALEQRKLGYHSHYNDTMAKLERCVGMKYWVYSFKEEEYYPRELTENSQWSILRDLINDGVVYIECQPVNILPEDLLRKLVVKNKNILDLIETFDLELEV